MNVITFSAGWVGSKYMPQHSVTFNFSVGDKVLLNEIQRPGVVDVLQEDNNGLMYRVAYWDCAERKTAWVYSEEISLRKL